ncbi:hypothetical protein P3T76_005916 [Phytophthora citrophthora]|uniref:Uncharacterized protein n=1 Tax=Phytophthora citrophthora TaxID=4793 RepID=A0AAD9GPS1_9STRA|nr:hypothetical protein P3T76_005916 [Phytophthora citrophthora]
MTTEDEAAPPPPPLSPPPAQEETTIGKYIARFRYEKPQPREVRAAAQRSDFWWTKSPRYTRSPSPPSPSTWASGAFSFPDEEEEDIRDELDESKDKIPVEDEESVENKWRQRLGLSSSDVEQRINDGKDSELSDAKSPVSHLWSSEEWGAVNLEEDEMEEDPEKVIERVRRRLNWGSIPGMNTSTPTRINLMEPPMSINTDRRQLRTKPPLSPLFKREDTRDSFGYSSPSSWGTIEREFGDDQFVKASLSSADAKDMVANGKEEEKSRDFDEMKTTRSERSADAGETQSSHSELLYTDIADQGLRSSISSGGSYSSQKSEPRGELKDNSVLDENNEEGPATTDFKAAYENNTALDNPKENLQPAVPEVPNPPQLPPRSPARPNFALDLAMTSPDYNQSVRSQDSTSSSVQRVSETAKTLDNLVSLVVHSWESDLFSPTRPINDQQEHATGNGEDSNDNKVFEVPVSPDAKVPGTVGDPSEDNETKADQDSTVTADNLAQKPTQPDPGEEETESSQVPGEEDDKVVQMLLGRISLLEKALRQLDS